MIELGSLDGNQIDELMELTAQSLSQLEIKEHFNVIKEIGRGKYGRVLLVTHRCRGQGSSSSTTFTCTHTVGSLTLRRLNVIHTREPPGIWVPDQNCFAECLCISVWLQDKVVQSGLLLTKMKRPGFDGHP